MFGYRPAPRNRERTPRLCYLRRHADRAKRPWNFTSHADSHTLLRLAVWQGCSASQGPPVNYAAEPDPRKHGFVLGPSDVLRISVWHNPDLSSDAIVRPDGNITLPLLGETGGGRHHDRRASSHDSRSAFAPSSRMKARSSRSPSRRSIVTVSRSRAASHTPASSLPPTTSPSLKR